MVPMCPASLPDWLASVVSLLNAPTRNPASGLPVIEHVLQQPDDLRFGLEIMLLRLSINKVTLTIASPFICPIWCAPSNAEKPLPKNVVSSRLKVALLPRSQAARIFNQLIVLNRARRT